MRNHKKMMDPFADLPDESTAAISRAVQFLDEDQRLLSKVIFARSFYHGRRWTEAQWEQWEQVLPALVVNRLRELEDLAIEAKRIAKLMKKKESRA